MTMNQRRTGSWISLGVALLWGVCLGFSSLVLAQQREDPASVVLVAPLHEAARQDAPVLATLRAGEAVTVLQMSGAYSRVKSDAGEGWVLSSRLQIGDQGSAGGAGSTQGSSWLRELSGLLGGAESGSGGSGGSVPIGIRGLQREDIANARPNPGAMAQLERYVVSASEAEARARAAGLEPVDLAYLPAPSVPMSHESGADR